MKSHPSSDEVLEDLGPVAEPAIPGIDVNGEDEDRGRGVARSS
jgi:hypothetical protein